MGGSKSLSTILLRSAEEREDMSREEVAERELTPDEELQTREGGEQGEEGLKSSSTIFLRSAEEREDMSQEEVAEIEPTSDET